MHSLQYYTILLSNSIIQTECICKFQPKITDNTFTNAKSPFNKCILSVEHIKLLAVVFQRCKLHFRHTIDVKHIT